MTASSVIVGEAKNQRALGDWHRGVHEGGEVDTGKTNITQAMGLISVYYYNTAKDSGEDVDVDRLRPFTRGFGRELYVIPLRVKGPRKILRVDLEIVS